VTRGQRRAHAIVFRVLAAFFVVALGLALARRQVVHAHESASLGHTRVHDATEPP